MFDLKNAVDLSNILGSLALVISVLLLFRELRETNRLTRAANSQAMVELSGPFYTSLFQDRQLAELFNHGAQDFDSLDGTDQYRYKQMLIWWLIFHENIFYQRRQGLLDRHTFKPWARDLKLFVQRQNLATHWPELRGLFQDEFASYVSLVLIETGQAPDDSPFFGPSAGEKPPIQDRQTNRPLGSPDEDREEPALLAPSA